MRALFNPGFEKKTINLTDNIVYSKVKDINGNDLELKLSIMAQNGNSEMRLAMGEDDPREDHSPKPLLIWVPGGGWRGADKNLMLGEMSDFVKAGYVVASIYYRNSAEGKWPSQIIDVKTAIRFLRSNADKYEIDPDRIGIMGRSAGGHLAAFAGQNLDGFDNGDNLEYSSEVQAAVDMFGPVDIGANMDSEIPKFKDPAFRWHSLPETHGGALIGGEESTIRERAEAASVTNFVNKNMAPLMILHGDNDPLVPKELSSDILYSKIKDKGLEDRCDYYIIPHAGHGTREYFQDSTKALMINFYNKNLMEESKDAVSVFKTYA